MANPLEKDKITLQDLLNSGMGGTITLMLCDCKGFWAYDNRESLDQGK